GAFRQIRVQSGTGDDHTVSLQDSKPADFVFQQFPRAPHQDAFLFQGFEQGQQAGDIVDGGGAQLFVTGLGQQGTAAIPGKQLLQQGAVFLVTDDMAAGYTLFQGLNRGRQATG